ncbi:BamA/TamA family outer membrane protein [Mucilaginibacter sp. JRF]|uniref:BamA/TamA family outer membrane protein n=1 Tax=Mucilaginibacter sp. JRF TaxID=2780088 RepID=UPI00187DF97C|nr:BamA/TamA family outer membrane protein [Mucilaginibacter sp. JRF]MBE9586212.1 BamA/TamA family outer membrane protein [Mucilaginibacter sp. JRF]
MKTIVVILLTVSMILLSDMVNAQHKTSIIPLYKRRLNDTLVALSADTIQQKDIYDVFRDMFHKHSETENKSSSVIGTKPVFSVLPAVGYTLQTKLAVTLAGNVAFRTSPTSRISTISSSTAYTQRKQIIIPIQSNIWTHNNDYNFIGDIRFYKYPQSTFGLGSGSSVAKNNPMDYTLIRLAETVLKKMSGSFYAGAGFIYDDHYGIKEKGNPDGSVSDYSRYGHQGRTISSGITLNALLDMRNSTITPTKGFYASMVYRDNKRFLGSTSSWKSLIVDVRKYYRLPADSKNVIALWSYNWLVLSGKPPYLDMPATTWDQNNGTGRGYIQGRFRGAQMIYLESEYRYQITSNGLLGGVVFVNGQSFSAEPGTAMQAIQPGYGAGLRIKLNKVSRTNISIDYGFGNHGSNGVFVAVGELF